MKNISKKLCLLQRVIAARIISEVGKLLLPKVPWAFEKNKAIYNQEGSNLSSDRRKGTLVR
jgi:hypothetical protein